MTAEVISLAGICSHCDVDISPQEWPERHDIDGIDNYHPECCPDCNPDDKHAALATIESLLANTTRFG